MEQTKSQLVQRVAGLTAELEAAQLAVDHAVLLAERDTFYSSHQQQIIAKLQAGMVADGIDPEQAAILAQDGLNNLWEPFNQMLALG